MFSILESSDVVFPFDGRSFPLIVPEILDTSISLTFYASLDLDQEEQRVRLKMKDNDY
jgi:hypothetical protein